MNAWDPIVSLGSVKWLQSTAGVASIGIGFQQYAAQHKFGELAKLAGLPTLQSGAR